MMAGMVERAQQLASDQESHQSSKQAEYLDGQGFGFGPEGEAGDSQFN